MNKFIYGHCTEHCSEVSHYKFQNFSPFNSAGEQISPDISSRPF